MTAVQLLKRDLDSEMKSGTKMVVNWGMYLETEKQQIIDALEYGWDNGHIHISILEDVEEKYYTSTYGSKRSDDTPMLDRLKAHLDSITPEQFNKEIDDIIKNDDSVQMLCEDCGMEECECSLTPDELIIKDLHNDRKSHAVDFAKWIALNDWMSMWVVDRWLWEYQSTMTEAQSKDYLGYKTEEQLYELYLKSL